MYKYRSLDTAAREIRVLDLLPGAFEDPIRIKINHHILPNFRERSVHVSPNVTRDEIQKTLPPDWVVRQCLDSRFLFERMKDYADDEPYETSWTHPTTGVDPNGRYDDDQGYEALSYVWAPEGAVEKAQVMKPSAILSSNVTSLSQGWIFIRPNLAAALRHLRYRDRARRLWIDALCINQTDIAERSSQVQLMGDIYRRAERVVVWLGSERENSKTAITVLRYLGEQVVLADGGARLTNVPGCQDAALGRSSVPLPYDEWTWQAIADLLQRPWFERLWVWQEARLGDESSIMTCGFDSISLSSFRRSVFCISNKRMLPSTEIRGLILDAVELMLPFSHQPFFRELQMLNWKQCADPRDKLYGALGAAPTVFRDHFQPDYLLSVEQVYRQFCLVYMDQLHRLDFLDRCDLDSRRIGGPSWLPDWSGSIDRAVRLPYADVFYAAGASASTATPLQDLHGDVLQAMGVSCGHVSFVGDKAPTKSDELFTTVQNWSRATCDSPTYRPTGERASDAFIALLGLDYTRERWPQCHSLLTVPEAAKLYNDTITSEDLSSTTTADSLNFIRVRGRYFFTTDSGYAGVIRSRPRVGDCLVVLLGCPSPLLLRPIEATAVGKGSQRWQIVGPGHVHGLMDTEALLGPLPTDWTVGMAHEHGFFDSMYFCNSTTGQRTHDDPRLGQDPHEWERLEAKRTSNDPWNFARYRHRETGEVVNWDPRLSPSALKDRGTEVQTFDLM